MTKNSPGKKATSFRLSAIALKNLALEADKRGITKTAVLEQLLRKVGK